MNRSEKVLREILTNQEEIDEFLKQETLEEIYEFVLKKDNGITKKEFDSCIAEIIEKYLVIEKANAVEKWRIKEEDMDMVVGGKSVLSKSMSSVLSTLVLTTGVNIPVSATNGEETNKTGIKSSIKEKVNCVIKKIDDAKRFVVKKGEEGFEKTSKILKEHPWIKPVLRLVIILVLGGGTAFAINRHEEKEIEKRKKEMEEIDREEREEKERERRKRREIIERERREQEKKKEERALYRVMRGINRNREELEEYLGKTWKERYEFISKKSNSITKEGFCIFMGVNPSVLTEEREKEVVTGSGKGDSQEGSEHAVSLDAAVVEEGEEKVNSREGGEEGSQE